MRVGLCFGKRRWRNIRHSALRCKEITTIVGLRFSWTVFLISHGEDTERLRTNSLSGSQAVDRDYLNVMPEGRVREKPK